MIPLGLVALILFAWAGACWYSPRFLRYTAARMMARADLLTELRAMHRARLVYWMEQCGVPHRRTPQTVRRGLEVV